MFGLALGLDLHIPLLYFVRYSFTKQAARYGRGFKGRSAHKKGGFKESSPGRFN